MPNLENIAGAVAGVASRHLVVEAGRCVEVRHRRARCGACMDTCPEGAIEVKDNRITVSPAICAGCGSCASECPTQALRMVDPSTSELLSFVDQVADTLLQGTAADHEPVLEFACEHAAASDADARIVVPALPYVDESVLVHAAAAGFDRIALTTCHQPGCLKPTLAAMPDALATARALLGAAGSACKITLRKQKPPAPDADGKPAKARKGAPSGSGAMAGAITYGNHEYSRRGMIADMAGQAKTIVAETAAAEMREKIGTPQAPPSLMQTLTDGRGNMLKFRMPRAESLLDDLYVLNPQPTGMVNVRGFARLEVAAAACTRCGMCARFCTTGALECDEVPIGSGARGAWGPFADPWVPKRDEEDVPEGSLTFRISDCVGCHLCETTCPLQCLRVNDEVDASTIFDLEPVDLLATPAG